MSSLAKALSKPSPVLASGLVSQLGRGMMRKGFLREFAGRLALLPFDDMFMAVSVLTLIVVGLPLLLASGAVGSAFFVSLSTLLGYLGLKISGRHLLPLAASQLIAATEANGRRIQSAVMSGSVSPTLRANSQRDIRRMLRQHEPARRSPRLLLAAGFMAALMGLGYPIATIVLQGHPEWSRSFAQILKYASLS